MANPIG